MNARYIVNAIAVVCSIVFSRQAHAAATSLTRTDKFCLLAPAPAMAIVHKAKMHGLPDASPFYRRHFDEALRAYGISNPEKIALKNASSMSKDTLGETTLFGVRLNEKLLSEHSISKRIFTCYHEAAHVALEHMPTSLKVATALSAGIFFSEITFNNKLKIALYLGVLPYTAWRASKIFYSWLKDSREKETDAIAMEYLIKNGKYYIVEKISHECQDEYNKVKEYLDVLKKLLELFDSFQKNKRDALSPLTKDQLALLKDTLEKNGWNMLQGTEKDMSSLNSDLKKAYEEGKNYAKESLEVLTRWKILSEQAYAKVRREHVVRSEL